MPNRFAIFVAAMSLGFCLSPAATRAQTLDAPPAEQGWPRPLSTRAATFSIYQPQLDKWDGYLYQAHAAVAVKAPGETRDTFGVIWIQAHSQVDKQSRLVSLRDLEIVRVEFPSTADKGQAYQSALKEAAKAGAAPPAFTPIGLDRLEASLAIAEAEKKGEAHPLKNDPPRLVFSTVPAILVSIDGQPVFKPLQGTHLQRVINTQPLLIRDGSTLYLHLYDGWLQSPALEGPWIIAANPPPALATAVKSVGNRVDLLDGASQDADHPRPTLANTIVPVVHVATVPTELVVTDGDPDYLNIPGTELLYVRNTTGNVFKSLTDQSWYILVSGRWFRASDLEGAWSYVDASQLPADFAHIPDDSPKENVKASVPGTQQAEEAVVASQIPQTATVERKGTTPAPPPSIDGPPKLEPIPDTSLQSVVNASAPIVLASDGRYYLVQNGLWFVADSPNGPWMVAAYVPPEIYSIPSSSPLHNVTYVRVYDATPEYVYVGYTPGYFGVELAPAGVVVYGTGYYYRPWIGHYWYPPPCTWGFGWGLAFTPWWGWSYGWGFGPVTVRFGFGGGWWHPHPWWGPYRWHDWNGRYHPVVFNSTTVNVYQRYGGNRVTSIAAVGRPGYIAPVGTRVGTAYNSRTGIPVAGQRATVVNAFTPRGEMHPTPAPVGRPAATSRAPSSAVSPQVQERMTPRPTGNHVYADKTGQIYRETPTGGWEQRTAGNWNRVNDAQKTQALSRESAARGWGEARTHGFNQAQSNFGTFRGGAPAAAPPRFAAPASGGRVSSPPRGGGGGGPRPAGGGHRR